MYRLLERGRFTWWSRIGLVSLLDEQIHIAECRVHCSTRCEWWIYLINWWLREKPVRLMKRSFQETDKQTNLFSTAHYQALHRLKYDECITESQWGEDWKKESHWMLVRSLSLALVLQTFHLKSKRHRQCVFVILVFISWMSCPHILNYSNFFWLGVDSEISCIRLVVYIILYMAIEIHCSSIIVHI